MNNLIRVGVACALALAGISLHTTPAAADGTIYAVLTLTNNTSQCLHIPPGSSQPSGLWGTEHDTLATFGSQYEVMPDGSPPAVLAPGQTMLWGSKSNGGFWPSGTGGSMSFALAGNQTAVIDWSVPWGYFNGSLASADTNGSGVTSSGFPPANPFQVFQASASCGGDNTCIFAMVISGGDPGSPLNPGQLGSSQCMAPPTACPSNVVCNPQTSAVTSTDGSTTLRINKIDVTLGGGPPAAWGGPLELDGPAGWWSNSVTDVAVVQMQSTGNLVAYDAGGNVVWQTNTSASNPFLSVTTNTVSVLQPQWSCFRFGTFWSCRWLDTTVWSATASSPPLQ